MTHTNPVIVTWTHTHNPSHTTFISTYVFGALIFLTGRLSVGCSVLDSALKGGILVPGVTEIAGTSAAGKTQLCLQLCLTVQLPSHRGGLDGGVGSPLHVAIHT